MTKKDTEFSPNRGSETKAQGNAGFCGFETGYGANPFGVNSFLFPNVPQYQRVPTLGLYYDMFEDGEYLTIEVPFPGLIADTLNVTQENQWLRVVGENETQPNANCSQRAIITNQIPRGIFDQTILLPYDVDPSSIKASFTSGVLTVTMKKTVSKDVHKVNVSFH